VDYNSCRDFHRGVVDLKESELQPDNFKWLTELHIMIPGFKERDIIVYVIESFGNSININFVLNPIELPESGVMVVMSMSPDHSIYAGKILPEKLLSEIRAGIYKDFTPIGLHKDRKTKALTLSPHPGTLACRTFASYFRGPDSIASPQQCKPHVYFFLS
jgi:hypothetical protein